MKHYFLGVRGSGAGLRVKSKDGMGLGLTNEDFSTLDMTLAWRGLVLMMEEACLAMKCSRNSTCSIMVLCVNRPPVVMSWHMSASISRPKQRDEAICHRVKTSLSRRVLTLKI